MKLQINTSGAWKDVAPFDAAQLAEVEAAVARLVPALGDSQFAVLRDDGQRLYYREGAFRPLPHKE